MLAEGREALATRYGAMFAACPGLHCDVVHRTCVGDYVVDEEIVSGRSAEPEPAVIVYHLAARLVDHERIVR